MDDIVLPPGHEMNTLDEELVQATQLLIDKIELNGQTDPSTPVAILVEFDHLKDDCEEFDAKDLNAHSYYNRAIFYQQEYRKYIDGYRALAQYVIDLTYDLVVRILPFISNTSIAQDDRVREMEDFRVRCVKLSSDSVSFTTEFDRLRGLFEKMKNDLNTLRGNNAGLNLPNAGAKLQNILNLLDVFKQFTLDLIRQCALISNTVHENEINADDATVARHYMKDVQKLLEALCQPMNVLRGLIPAPN